MYREGENLDNLRGRSARVAPMAINYEVTEESICRICMEPNSRDMPLISPCKCAGSVKYIHEECLKTWLISQEGDIDEGQCELCKTSFLMEFKIGRKCTPKESVKNGWTQILYLPVLTGVMLMLFLVIFLLADRYINVSQGTDNQGYAIALMITCGVSGLVLFILLITTLREICFIMSLEEWHIYSQSFENDSEVCINDKKDHKDETCFYDHNFGTILIIPENLIVKGVKVRTPLISPSLAPLNQRGRIVGYASRGVSPDLNGSASFSVPLRMNTDPLCY